MENGTFDMCSLLTKGVEAGISYIEESAEEIQNISLDPNAVKNIEESKIEQNDETVVGEGLDHFSTYFLRGGVVALVAQSDVQTITNQCMGDVSGGLTCTANDVSIASVQGIQILDLDGGCTYPGDTVTFTATWDVQSTATKRYNVGLYFAADGQTDPLHGTCSISSLPNGPEPDFYNFDDNACGDISKDAMVHP
jgi:hypothetical protein